MLATSLDDPVLSKVLERLHTHDGKNRLDFVRAAVPFIVDGLLRRDTPVQVRAKRDRKLALCITPTAGRFLYLTARALGARRIVEFGTSFGVSTLYLAAALRDNGGGMVISSELELSKVREARQNIEDANLSKFAEIRAGDARETLSDPGGSVDMVLLDGAKELYLPVLRTLEKHLRTGTVLLADDVILFRKVLTPYISYVQNQANGFQSVTLEIGAGLEYSVKL